MPKKALQSGPKPFPSASEEVLLSVDIEAAGAIPGRFSLLQIGACRVDGGPEEFCTYVRPINSNSDPAALAVTGLSLQQVRREGLAPKRAMSAFRDWIYSVAPLPSSPVFVGLNAAFDWSFINYYFVRYLGSNPFGIAPIDIKSVHFGQKGGLWSDANAKKIQARTQAPGVKSHDALEDARFQAELFRRIRVSPK